MFSQQLFQRDQRAMVERLDGSFATSHDLADPGIGQAFHELENQQLLPVAGKATDGREQSFMLFALGREVWQIVGASDEIRAFCRANCLTGKRAHTDPPKGGSKWKKSAHK